jgi:hypothetical protein
MIHTFTHFSRLFYSAVYSFLCAVILCIQRKIDWNAVPRHLAISWRRRQWRLFHFKTSGPFEGFSHVAEDLQNFRIVFCGRAIEGIGYCNLGAKEEYRAESALGASGEISGHSLFIAARTKIPGRNLSPNNRPHRRSCHHTTTWITGLQRYGLRLILERNRAHCIG